MNKCFTDIGQKTLVKVLKNSRAAKREIFGAKIFSQFVKVPAIEKLDTKTLRVSLLGGLTPGKTGKLLNNLIANLLVEINKSPVSELKPSFSIFENIQEMKEIFADDPQILKALSDIESLFLKGPLYPVHGDLQKQNLLIKDQKLILFDFEHFTFGPQELDLVNSLFFDDENCLDVDKIIPVLIKKGIINPKLLQASLVFFGLKELALGRSANEVKSNLIRGYARLASILEDKRESQGTGLYAIFLD